MAQNLLDRLDESIGMEEHNLGRDISDSDAAILETMQLPSAMELAQMGLGLGSRKTSPLQEGLGAFGFQPHQLPTPERLSPYEEMLMLLSLGIPGAALGGRAVGGLMRGMKGRGIPARNEEALEKILNAPSAMRDMGPQLGRPIPGRIKGSIDKILGSGQRASTVEGNLTAAVTALDKLKTKTMVDAIKKLKAQGKWKLYSPTYLGKNARNYKDLGIKNEDEYFFWVDKVK